MSEAQIRLYRFLVDMGRITEEQYEQMVGVAY